MKKTKTIISVLVIISCMLRHVEGVKMECNAEHSKINIFTTLTKKNDKISSMFVENRLLSAVQSDISKKLILI